VILRAEFFAGLDSTLDDLKTPERLPDPVATAREGAIFARLLEALDRRQVSLPDEEARARIERLAMNFDRTWDHSEIATTHAAHQALLDVLGGAEGGCGR
jgi:hypothetical protein